MPQPTDAQLQSFRLTHPQFHILTFLAAGAHPIEASADDFTALERRGFIIHQLHAWTLTATGIAILNAIRELL